MSPTVVIDNEFVTLMVHPETKIVHHQLHKPMSGEVFRTMLLAGVDQLRQHDAKKWLSDNRRYGAVPKDDMDWSMSTWFPQAKEAGWRTWAIVVPADVFARMNLGDFVLTYGVQGIRVQVFTDPDEALVWLESAE